MSSPPSIRSLARLLRRSRRQPSLFVVLVLLILAGYRLAELSAPSAGISFESAGPYRVTRVVDGDTLLLENEERVRLIGVDTPEVKHPKKPPEPYGLEASNFTRDKVEGELVTLKYDRERRDKYRRVLAYVYLEDFFLNEEIIKAGLGKAQLQYPYSSRMKKRFKDAEEFAREQKVGLWSQF